MKRVRKVRSVRPAFFLVGLALLLLTSACRQGTVEAAAPAPAPAPPTASTEYPMWETVEPGENALYNQRESLIQRGRLVYEKYCISCHGEYGDGEGPGAARLITKPRDFTRAVYKFRSTDSSSLPMEADLHRTITRGLARVGMPAFPLMPENEKVAVIEYIKAFNPRWERRKGARNVVYVPGAPQDLADPERIARGRIVYVAIQCWRCHGINGRGEGATQAVYKDAKGNEQKPFDFTQGRLKSGDRPEDIYRAFHTGLGSIMPSFGGDLFGRVTQELFTVPSQTLSAAEREALSSTLAGFPETNLEMTELSAAELVTMAERNSWDLVAYILSLRETITTADAVLGTGESR